MISKQIDNRDKFKNLRHRCTNSAVKECQAADQYLENIVALQKRAQADRFRAEAEARSVLEQAQREREELLEKTRQECREIIQQAKACTR